MTDPADAQLEPLENPAEGIEDEPRRVRQLVAPLALVAGLAVAIGGAILIPSSASEDIAEASGPQATSAQPQHTNTPSVLPSPSRTSHTPKASATTSVSQKPKPSVSPTVKAVPSKATPSASSTSKVASSVSSATATPRETVETVAPLSEVVGTRYATEDLNVRRQPDVDSERIGGLRQGDEVKVTELHRDGWRQVSLDGKPGWVRSGYLSLAKPAAEARAATPSRTTVAADDSEESASAGRETRRGTASSSDGTSVSRSARGLRTDTCPTSAPSGLTAATRSVHQAVCGNFPSITNYGGARGSDDAHGSGRALDVMVSGQQGWEVARWARANAARLGITEVIYSQQIWTTQRSGEGWRSMGDRGSATANHYDHVHITVG
ncbi:MULTISPECIES: SH3 domain-containing protein [unclassified Luteococcus]|uniref:SH3 domain-containing protein n=1 Tax=unclassified Luteococcus TaxID=2639923 RepID=UPI00313BC2AC